MKISIVLLSRERTHLLRNALKSIQDNSDDISNVEVFVGLDLDDTQSLSEVEEIEEEFPFCHMIFRTRQFNMHHYLNELARMSTGDYVLGINDDCQIMTPGWDSKLMATTKMLEEKWPDGVIHVAPKDSSIDKVGTKEYASFPIVSRTAILACGIFVDQTFPCHGADVVTWRIYSAIDRIHQTACFEIDHILHSTPELLDQKDETASIMIRRTFSSPTNFWTSDISDIVGKLRKHINEKAEYENLRSL